MLNSNVNVCTANEWIILPPVKAGVNRHVLEKRTTHLMSGEIVAKRSPILH